MTPLEQPLSLKAQSSTWGDRIPEPDWHLYTPAELTEFWGEELPAGETVTADRARELWAANKGRKVARLEEIKAALMEERQHRLDAELGRLGGTEADLAAELAQQAAAYDMTVTDPVLAEEIREAAWEYIRTEGEWPSWYDPEPEEAQVETDAVWPDAASWATRKPQAPDPGEAERDRLIEEAAERFPEYSHLDQQQAAIDADARANWNGYAYPPYEGPGYTEPPVNWEGWHSDHSEYERDHYWDPESDHAGLAAADHEGFKDIPEARTEDSSPSSRPAPGPPPRGKAKPRQATRRAWRTVRRTARIPPRHRRAAGSSFPRLPEPSDARRRARHAATPRQLANPACRRPGGRDDPATQRDRLGQPTPPPPPSWPAPLDRTPGPSRNRPGHPRSRAS